ALADDLALALAASPIRIEAPVPGRPYVGIEVPNDEPSLVSLREVMESKEFREMKSPLKLALGKGVSGQPVVADLTAMPHLLIAGATGSGKSVCINSIVTCLVMQNPPERLRLLLVDPKRVELAHFNGLPHLLAPVVMEVKDAIGALTWLVKMMEERYDEFAKMKARHLEDYNSKARAKGKEPLPYIALIIDELADIMIAAPDEAERKLTRLAQLSRATGIHLVLATQRPSVDVITGLIKANFPARISFAVTSQVDSRVILDMAGAERLLGRGDMLFLPPDQPTPIRLQGCYVSAKEIKRVVDYWREKRPLAAEEIKGFPWEGLLEEEKEDELTGEALELLKSYQRVSISLLQRKLHLGYPRAARLMEYLEEHGYVRYDENLRAYLVVRDNEAEVENLCSSWETQQNSAP
ncbi:MAG TPA: DNA translocase FtsK, partial [Chloroflexi bacterium]|nr:DNA translocase FtsK [Chloroflexota bacterium]